MLKTSSKKRNVVLGRCQLFGAGAAVVVAAPRGFRCHAHLHLVGGACTMGVVGEAGSEQYCNAQIDRHLDQRYDGTAQRLVL